MNLRGSYVALVTPMNNDYSVNYDVLDNLIDFHLNNQTDGLVILGTTAESPTLSSSEKEEIVKFTVKKVNHRIPVIVGSGSNSTYQAIENSKKYESLGADGLLVITPYYNKTNESGMIRHFEEIAKSVHIPIIMYNVPSRTGCSLSVNAVGHLSKIENIIGLKEATGNISFVAKCSKFINENFAILSGNDDQIVPVMSLGGSGVISVWANIMPKTVHDLCEAYLNGNTKEAARIQLEYLDVCNDLFLETNPIPVKCAMNYLGTSVGPCRLPLDEMSEGAKNVLYKTIERIRGLN